MQDAIIVGGGPVGFITALGLAQAGVTVTVIEAEPHIINSPRAAVYHWSVLDGLERLGIRAEAETIGFQKQDYIYLVQKTGERVPYSLEALEGHTRYPYNLHLGQHQLAEIARARLAALPNATVYFSTRAVGLAQDADGVTLTVETAGREETLRAHYLIGADGANSTIRRLLGLDFEGMTWPERFIATNVYYDFERWGYARSALVIDETYGAIIAKLDNDGLWRCTYMEDASLPEESFMERLPGMYAKILPGEGEYKVDRASPYRMHQRSAPTYRVGRVVLAGDAAHATNPTGGLGLTTGLFDSYALYPALAAVLLERADPEVLDRYSEARRAIFLTRTSPRATANKQLIYHANGGGAGLDEVMVMVRRLASDKDFLREQLMFTRTLETPALLGDAVAT